MNPEAADAIRIAEKHLAGASIERQKALAHEINEAIIRHAGTIAAEAIHAGIKKAQEVQRR